MTEYIFVYRPTKSILDKFKKKSIEIVDSRSFGSYNEYIFQLEYKFSNLDEFQSWLREELYTNALKTVVSNYNYTKRGWISDTFEITDEVTIEDIIDDKPVCDLIQDKTSGGDIRKYTSSFYGGVSRCSIDFKLYRSRDTQITGMEPIRMNQIQKLIDLDICSNHIKTDNPIYPPAGNILEWSKKVNDKWGLECGALGSIHISGEDRLDIEMGFDGFVIYDADREVKNWCDKRWARTNHENSVFMRPSEYTYRSKEDEMIPRSVIRMWWD